MSQSAQIAAPAATASAVAPDPGKAMYGLAEELYPICRSLTGPGVRETLRVIGRQIPLEMHEVASGTKVFDWIVPNEWQVREAYIADESGRRVIDFRRMNLHVVGYSRPVRRKMTLTELRPHLHTLPERPEAVPYRTSYYDDSWGFCLSQRQLEALSPNETYDVCIDSTLAPGALTYGEYYLPGTVPDEVLFSCHVCHPALANDNVAGMVVAVALAKLLAERRERRLSYRFLFVPATLGPLAWMSRNRERLAHIRAGLVLALLGDGGPLTFKQSRSGDTAIDRAATYVLRARGVAPPGVSTRIRPFIPIGNDERQYGSPGFNLPVGSLTRTPSEEYPEYHTSDDNLELIQPQHLADSLSALEEIVDVLEHNRRYRNLAPYGEPQLGRRGLYRAVSGQTRQPLVERAYLWVLNYSDGNYSLLDIAERASLPFGVVRQAAERLLAVGLLEAMEERAEA